ncbi:MAG: rRNA (uracil1498-N3)-methyltransferase [Patescibacteria group bacterium]|jgi:16S rRNA (uracil1498-N3)-methyltransferase|nr:rRNA (uracil1498-N3)-methyltransferase [Patescibacteria group bacterium]
MKKIHRFINNYNIEGNSIAINEPELIHQWKNVLKFKIGEQIILANPNGMEALCEIESIDKKEATLKLIEETENTKTVKRMVTLYASILKRENFEFIAQKATELGVKSIVPIKTERTIKQNINMERLGKIVTEASELCGRNTVPEICETMNFKDAITLSTKENYTVLFDATGENLANKIHNWQKKMAIFIGPEGGFTESELEFARENNIEIISISPLMLRGETAAIVATYLAVNL